MAFDVFEQESRSAGPALGARLLLTRSVISAISRIGSARCGLLQFARAVQRGDPIPKIVVGQEGSRKTHDYTGQVGGEGFCKMRGARTSGKPLD